MCLVSSTIKVPIIHRVKYKLNLTFYVIKNKGLECGLEEEAKMGSPAKTKKPDHKGQAFLPGVIFREE